MPKRKSRRGRADRRTVGLGVELLETRCLLSPTFTEYGPLSGPNPEGITLGPDGNIWFAEFGGDKIGRITPNGSIMEFPLAAGSKPAEITTGPDGNLWFTENGGNKVGRITPAGAVTEFPTPTSNSKPVGIAVGPDGNLWFTESWGNRMASITTAGTIHEQPSLSCGPINCTPINPNPFIVALGPDNNLWYTVPNFGGVTRMILGNPIQEHESFFYDTFGNRLDPTGIAPGPDNAMWFTEPQANQIVRISTDMTTTTTYPLSLFNGQSRLPERITLGPDNNLWFTEAGASEIGRITPTGTISEYAIRSGSTADLGPLGIATGLAGSFWFTENTANEVGQGSLSSGVPQTYVVTTTADSGAGSLRQAILNANANLGTDTITFQVPGSGIHVIQPASPLPQITDPLVIDGTSQPGYAGSPLIQLDGTNAGSGSNGLVIVSGNSTVQGLDLSNFNGNGIVLQGGSNNVVQGNYIGTDTTGTIARGNGQNGIVIYGGSHANRVGTNGDGVGDTAERNIISGNQGQGVLISDAWTNRNVVAGNYIGTDVTGKVGLGNRASGIWILNGPQGNRIGVNSADADSGAEGNLIAANGARGVAIDGSGTNQNIVAGNYIGTDVTGTIAMGNGLDGVGIFNGAQTNRIGTDGDGVKDTAERNVISGNAGQGVHISDAGTNNNVVAGNFIGVDLTGRVALGNTATGVWVHNGAQMNRIGTNGTDADAAGERNVISANGVRGVALESTGTNQNLVAGNSIGTDATGTLQLGNGDVGVIIDNGASSNPIGGSAVLGNSIAYNKQPGVVVYGPTSTGNSIRANSIFGNGGLGIDLGGDGVTLNHPGGAATGPNNLQNYPVLATAASGTTTTVSGTLNSTAKTPFTLDFYASTQPDPTMFGQGQRYLGSISVTTDAVGNAGFSAKLPSAPAAGEWLSATATDPGGDTSEFAADLQLPPAPATHFAVSAPATATAGAPFTVTVQALDDSGNVASTYADTVHFTSSDGQAVLPADYPFTSADKGTHSFTVTLKTAGSRTVTVADTVNSAITSSVSVLVSGVAATQFGVMVPAATTAGTAFDVTVTAQDPYGNTDPTYRGSVQVGSDDQQAVLPGPYAFGAADNGIHTFSGAVTLRTAGTRTVTATDVATASITGSRPLTVNAAAATHLGLTAPASAPAGAAFDVTVAALDPYGNPDPAYRGTVQFTSTDAQAVLPGPYAFAASDSGKHTFAAGVTLKTMGGRSLTAAATGFASATTPVTVAAAPASRFTVSAPATSTAGGSFDVTVTALDQFGNTVTNYRGTVRLGSDDPQTTPPAGYTFTTGPGGDNGVHTFAGALTLYTAGSRTVTAMDGASAPVAGSTTVAVNALAATHLGLTVPATATAGTAFDVTVAALDPYGNPDPTYQGTVQITSTDAQAVLPDPYTFGSGDHGAHTFAGGGTLKTAGGLSLTAAGTAFAPVSAPVQVAAAPASHFMLTAPSASTAGTPFDVTVTALDRFGNTDTNYQGAVQVGSDDNKAAVPGLYHFTTATGGDNGVHRFAGGVTLKTAGARTVTTTDTASTSVTGSVPVTVAAAAATHLGVSAPASTTAGVPLTLTISALDPFGNPDPTYAGTVHVTSTDGQAALPASYAFQSADGGSHPFVVTLKTAGNRSVTATDNVFPPASAAVQVSAAAAMQLGVRAPAASTAGAPFDVTVTALDPYGNTDPGYRGTVRLDSSAAQRVVPAPYTFVRGDNGVHTFAGAVILDSAGRPTVTATDATRATIAGTATVQLGAAAATHLAIAAPASSTAGTAFTITVTLLDPFDNTATGYTGILAFDSTDNKPVLPMNYLFSTGPGGDNGTHTFISAVVLHTAGSQTVSAADTGHASLSGSAMVQVGAAAATHLRVSAPLATVAGTSFAVTVSALDPFDNPDPTYTGTVQVGSDDTKAMVPPPYTFVTGDGGSHTFAPGVTLRTAGTPTVTATDAGNAFTGSTSVQVSAAVATHLGVAAPTTATAGVPIGVTVSALDPFDNLDPTYRGTVALTSNDGQATMPGGYAFTATDAGSHSFPGGLTLRTSGSRTLTAADTGSLTGTDAVLVTGAAATHLALAVAASTTAGAAVDLTVRALDPFGNPDPSYHGTVRLGSDDARATLPASYTFTTGSGGDDGSHTFPGGVILRTAGRATLTAADAGLAGGAAAVPVAVSPTAAVVTLTSSPSPAILGQPVTLTALVQAANPAAGTPTGTIAFLDGATVLGVVPLDPTGQARFTTPALGLGAHARNAVYAGDATFVAGAPALFSQVVADQPVSEVTGSLSIRLGRPRRRPGRVQFSVTLTNVGGRALEGPISLVFDGLRRRVKLRGASGFTSGRSPYLDLAAGTDNLLAPGATLSVTLLFSTTAGVRFNLRILAGVGAR
jgi:streptogramin lyase